MRVEEQISYIKTRMDKLSPETIQELYDLVKHAELQDRQLLERVLKAEEDIMQGRVMTQEEFEKALSKKS